MTFTPPAPAPPPGQLSFLAFLKAVRTDALRIWPEDAYERDVVVHRSLGRSRVLLNAPDAINHVLLANAANYRRSPYSIRVLRPIVGDGLLLSEGEAWKRQRRTIAPALAPRMMPVLSRHIAAEAASAVEGLQAQAASGAPADLLAAMQALALEVAARSMFSIGMGEHGATMRAMIKRYADGLGKPYLLDLFLPPSVLTPHDYARRRFQAEWRAFVDGLIRARLAEPEPEQPRDLFDMLRAARDPDDGAAFDAASLRDQTATMIVAGHETTSATLFWALYLLANDPDAQAWVAEEAAGADLSPDGAFAALPGLVRTRAVVNETLRLSAPAPSPLEQPRGVRPGPLRRLHARPPRLPAVRGRAAGLRRRAVRADRGDDHARRHGAGVRRLAAPGGPACAASIGGHDPAGPRAGVPHLRPDPAAAAGGLTTPSG